MNKGFAIGLLIAGIVCLVWGFAASDSVTSGFSKLFSGAPTDKTIWLLIGGTIATLAGFFGVLRRA
ncbi:MAG TPA: DUF3185 family protein [Opitutales bacterium]|nr:DUF3185 family protein [Opitutales bacterium]